MRHLLRTLENREQWRRPTVGVQKMKLRARKLEILYFVGGCFVEIVCGFYYYYAVN